MTILTSIGARVHVFYHFPHSGGIRKKFPVTGHCKWTNQQFIKQSGAGSNIAHNITATTCCDIKCKEETGYKGKLCSCNPILSTLQLGDVARGKVLKKTD